MDLTPRSTNTDSSSDENSILICQAIRNIDVEYIISQLDNGMDINAPILTKGPFAGFTMLHLMCIEKIWSVFVHLLRVYKVDVNVMADDGVQPIHLALLSEWNDIDCLLSKENVNATIKREIFLKYAEEEEEEWCPDFGDEMTLLTYAVIYKKDSVGESLVKHGANVDITSLTNQPLIIYALDNRLHKIALDMINVFSENLITSTINYRDTDGVPISHYPLHPKLFGKFRFTLYEDGWDGLEGDFVENIILAGADKYGLINNDPATFLPNLAAYRGFPNILSQIFHLYESIDQSRALYYATLPIDENADNYLRIDPGQDKRFFLKNLRERRERCVKIIIIELISRIALGLPVPEEEKKIMDNLIATDTNIREYVQYYEKNILNGLFRKVFIEVNKKELSFFDLCVQMFSRRKLNILAKSFTEQNIYHAFNLIFENSKEIKYDKPGFIIDNWMVSLVFKLKNAQKRLELVEQLKKVTQLRKAVPLSFELVLDMIEYLNNVELKTFIAAFRYP